MLKLFFFDARLTLKYIRTFYCLTIDNVRRINDISCNFLEYGTIIKNEVVMIGDKKAIILMIKTFSGCPVDILIDFEQYRMLKTDAIHFTIGSSYFFAGDFLFKFDCFYLSLTGIYY